MSKQIEITIQEYDAVFNKCRSVFEKKTKDYGTSWRMLRARSITDQLYIKAKRIRTIDEKGEQKIGDSMADEFLACVNYGIIALIQLEIQYNNNINYELTEKEALAYYNKYYHIIKDLMIAKNHDYGEAWRDMRVSSFTDLILSKLHRIKQIEDNEGKTIASEGIDANYMDIVNYAVFALIQIDN